MSWQDIPGWCDFTDIYAEAVARAENGAVFVEVGVAFGRSAAFMAREILNSKKDITLYVVDPWVDDWNPDWTIDETHRPTWGAEHAVWAREQGGPFSAFVQMMRTHAPAELELMKVLRCKGSEAAHILPCVDFAFIDGDHRFEGCSADIRAWLPKVQVNGVLAGHDYTHEFPGVERAVTELLINKGYAVQKRGTSWYLPMGV